MSQFGVPDPLPLDGPLWIFALAVYSSDGVCEACLSLQEQFGVDVNLLLFSAWLGTERGIVLTKEDAEQARNLILAWNDEVVGSLRTLRRKLKAWPIAALRVAGDPLREEIKAVELQSERIELAWLEYHAAAWQPTLGTDTADAVMRNLQTILTLTAGQKPLVPASHHLDVIACASRKQPAPRPG